LSSFGSDSDDEEDDEDDGQWAQYREVGEGDVDEDADGTDPLIPDNRYQLPAEVRKAARSALGAANEEEEEDDWGDGEAGPSQIGEDGNSECVSIDSR
jgi:hypothetical protein